MQKTVQQLSRICNWIISFELIFALWSLWGIFPIFSGGHVDWATWGSFAFYGALLYLFATLKNKVAHFRDFDEAGLREVDPTAIIPTRFGIFLMSFFAVHMVTALFLVTTQGFFYMMFLVRAINGQSFMLALCFFILPVGVLIQGTRLYILISKLKRVKKILPELDKA